MTFFVCKRCQLLIKVVGDPFAISNLIIAHPRWKMGMPCIGSCGNMFEQVLPHELSWVKKASESGTIKIWELTPEQFFSALCGFGLPDEITAEPETVSAMLLSSRVTKVSVSRSPSGRVILDKLELDNGVVMNLASSSYGPVVLKLTRRANDVRDGHGQLQEGAAGHELPSTCGCGRGECRRAEQDGSNSGRGVRPGGCSCDVAQASSDVHHGSGDVDPSADQGACEQTTPSGS